MNSDPINTVVLEAIQQTWRKELNIDVGIAQTEFRVYADDMHRLAFKILRSRWVADYNDPSNFIEMFITNSPNNNSGWSNPEYDHLVDEANHQLDQTKRFELLNQAETLLLDEAPIAPVFFGTRTYLIDPHVKGWVPSLLGIHRYQKVWLE
jgi:oligopeptide transport system substrate-binding protein